MLDHVSIQVTDIDAATAFYLDVFGPLGFRQAMRFDGDEGTAVGISGSDGMPRLWLGSQVDGGDRPIHLAFTASTRAQVDDVQERAKATGAEILHEARIWPEYHEQYYGVFLRDPDGNNVEAVCHLA